MLATLIDETFSPVIISTYFNIHHYLDETGVGNHVTIFSNIVSICLILFAIIGKLHFHLKNYLNNPIFKKIYLKIH